jgi:hypothetical protein
MTISREPLIGKDDEVREITADDLKYATRGRPAMPNAAKKKRVNLMLDPDVATALDREANKSAYVNGLLRKGLGL